jgi:hypothetical protein
MNAHWIAGLLAVAVYVFAVALGGYLWPAYSHLAQPVSDLIASGAPPKEHLDPLFALYNVLTGVFGLGVALTAQQPSEKHSRIGVIGGWTLVVEAVAGLVTLAFPESEGGANASIGATGVAHIVFAGISSITSLLAIVLIGRWLSRTTRSTRLWQFSVLSAVVVVATGIVAGVSVANRYSFAGLAERLTIGAFLLWQVAAAWSSRSLTAKAPAPPTSSSRTPS